MAFDKSYPNRKDRRRPYRRKGRFDETCRPHGRCPVCRRDRLTSSRRRMEAAGPLTDPEEDDDGCEDDGDDPYCPGFSAALIAGQYPPAVGE